ncbi:unnamed protein product [Diabrotica balteata]|uniref:PiggyBac transposable element-derived protein domain-containing protein n=1 Tax=Diabrotica balteata TaxID=107213 RepID=A0A9N9TBJ2_DIABA|nr:unnamed protein product [Diabrotica balteata]
MPIYDYNKNMGGVDHFDQYMSTYISWKYRRWWMKLYYYLISTSIVNADISYKMNCIKRNTKPMSALMFRSNLADELTQDNCTRKTPGPKVIVSKTKWKICKHDRYCTKIGHRKTFIHEGKHDGVVL